MIIFQGKLTFPLIIAVITIVVGCSLQFGYHTGCINSSKPMVEFFIKYQCNFWEDLTWPWAIVVALFPFGAVFGSFMGAPLADRYGRRLTLFINCVPAALAGVFFLLAYFCKKWYLFYPGRLLIGINSGITSSAAVTYITELAPVNLRGMLGSCHQLICTIGILNQDEQRNSLILFPALTFAPVVIHFVLLLICPESPTYTVTFRHDEAQATKDLQRLRRRRDVAKEIELIKKENEVEYLLKIQSSTSNRETRNERQLNFMDKAKSKDFSITFPENFLHQTDCTFTDISMIISFLSSFSKYIQFQTKNVSLKELFQYEYRWPLLLSCVMMVMQQFSGINAAMYYSSVIFEKAGLTGSVNTLASCGLMLANVLMTLVSTYLVDHPRFGRRLLLLSGISGMIVCTIVSVISLSLIDAKIATTVFQIIAVVFMILYVVSFATGPGAIPWFYVMELFSSEARASASSVACAVNWLSNVLVGLLFPVIQEYLKSFTFLIFTAFLLVCGTFIFYYVPETKGRTVEEIKISTENKRPRWI
uniref:MFS domain-containing protein n=1 Tax=Syphacia muris TaxID=451379 RepID=A0A0N5AWS0_9BILA